MKSMCVGERDNSPCEEVSMFSYCYGTIVFSLFLSLIILLSLSLSLSVDPIRSQKVSISLSWGLTAVFVTQVSINMRGRPPNSVNLGVGLSENAHNFALFW